MNRLASRADAPEAIESSERTLSRACGSAIAVALLARPFPLFAHNGPPPTPADIWSAWSWYPEVLLAIGIAAMVYARGVGRLWTSAGAGRGIPRWRFFCFAGGLFVLLVALVSPLDALGSALFSAHMVQHELLMLVAAPLLVLGAPWLAIVWALPLEWRHRLGELERTRPLRALGAIVSSPFTAWSVYAVALWGWHVPSLYQATLRSEPVHIAQHTTFLAASILFWWILLNPGHSRRSGYGAGIVYIFATAVHGSVLGALLTFSREPWYPEYAPSTAAWGLTPLDDQQLAGLVMWVPPGFLYLGAAVTVMGLWLRAIERRSDRRAVSLSDPIRRMPDARVAGRPPPGEASHPSSRY